MPQAVKRESSDSDQSMDIKAEFIVGMIMQLVGLVLLAFYFGRRMSQDAEAANRSRFALLGTALAMLGTALQIFAASR